MADIKTGRRITHKDINTEETMIMTTKIRTKEISITIVTVTIMGTTVTMRLII